MKSHSILLLVTFTTLLFQSAIAPVSAQGCNNFQYCFGFLPENERPFNDPFFEKLRLQPRVGSQSSYQQIKTTAAPKVAKAIQENPNLAKRYIQVLAPLFKLADKKKWEESIATEEFFRYVSFHFDTHRMTRPQFLNLCEFVVKIRKEKILGKNDFGSSFSIGYRRSYLGILSDQHILLDDSSLGKPLGRLFWRSPGNKDAAQYFSIGKQLAEKLEKDEDIYHLMECFNPKCYIHLNDIGDEEQQVRKAHAELSKTAPKTADLILTAILLTAPVNLESGNPLGGERVVEERKRLRIEALQMLHEMIHDESIPLTRRLYYLRYLSVEQLGMNTNRFTDGVNNPNINFYDNVITGELFETLRTDIIWMLEQAVEADCFDTNIEITAIATLCRALTYFEFWDPIQGNMRNRLKKATAAVLSKLAASDIRYDDDHKHFTCTLTILLAHKIGLNREIKAFIDKGGYDYQGSKVPGTLIPAFLDAGLSEQIIKILNDPKTKFRSMIIEEADFDRIANEVLEKLTSPSRIAEIIESLSLCFSKFRPYQQTETSRTSTMFLLAKRFLSDNQTELDRFLAITTHELRSTLLHRDELEAKVSNFGSIADMVRAKESEVLIEIKCTLACLEVYSETPEILSQQLIGLLNLYREDSSQVDNDLLFFAFERLAVRFSKVSVKLSIDDNQKQAAQLRASATFFLYLYSLYAESNHRDLQIQNAASAAVVILGLGEQDIDPAVQSLFNQSEQNLATTRVIQLSMIIRRLRSNFAPSMSDVDLNLDQENYLNYYRNLLKFPPARAAISLPQQSYWSFFYHSQLTFEQYASLVAYAIELEKDPNVWKNLISRYVMLSNILGSIDGEQEKFAAWRAKFKGNRDERSDFEFSLLKTNQSQSIEANYRVKEKVGEWKAEQLQDKWVQIKIPAENYKFQSTDGVRLLYSKGLHRLNIRKVSLYYDGKEVASDDHLGYTGTHKHRNFYLLKPKQAPTENQKVELIIEGRGDGGSDSNGEVHWIEKKVQNE